MAFVYKCLSIYEVVIMQPSFWCSCWSKPEETLHTQTAASVNCSLCHSCMDTRLHLLCTRCESRVRDAKCSFQIFMKESFWSMLSCSGTENTHEFPKAVVVISGNLLLHICKAMELPPECSFSHYDELSL